MNRILLFVLVVTQVSIKTYGQVVPSGGSRTVVERDHRNISCTTAGTSTVYTCAPVPAFVAYADKSLLVVKFHIASGANPTIIVNGLLPKKIYKTNSTLSPVPIATGELRATVYILRFDASLDSGAGAFITDTGGGSGGGGGASSFDQITSGQNTSSFMDVSTGAALTFSGTGVVNANRFVNNPQVAIADGGTGANSASLARSNLGLAIGTNIQAHSADLDAIAGVSATGFIRRTGAAAFVTTLASGVGTCGANLFINALADNASPTCVQPSSGNLSDGSALAKTTISNTWSPGVTQTFAPNAANVGFNFGSTANNPSAANNGDAYYNSTANELRARINGAWVALGSGGGGGGISSLNGQTGAVQTFVNDANVTIVSSTNTHTITWAAQLALTRGGTGSNLGATGGVGQFLKQTTAGANVTVATIGASDLPSHTHAAADITSGTFGLVRGGTNQITWTAGRCVQVSSDGSKLEPATSACNASGTPGTVNLSSTFTSQTSVTITHNWNTTDITYSCVTTTNKPLFADGVTRNAFTVVFAFEVATSGTCTVNGGSGGINSLNGLVSLSQSFVIGTAGSDFAVTSSGSSHTFNLPDASVLNRGVINSSSQSFAGIKTFASGLVVGDGAGDTLSFTAQASDPTCSSGNYFMIARSDTAVFRLCQNGTMSTIASGGTVSSVGLSMPTEFSVSGSPVSTSGTLTAAWASGSPNRAFMTPNGSSGVPSFRALVAADVPSLDTSKITTGTLALARGGTNQTAWTASRCVQVNSAGTSLESATGACGSGGGGSGDVIGPATNTDSFVPQWNGTNTKTLKDGLQVSAAPSFSTLVQRQADGTIHGFKLRSNVLEVDPGGGDNPSVMIFKSINPQVSDIVQFLDVFGVLQAAINTNFKFTGVSAKADQFTSTPTGCGAGQFATSQSTFGNFTCGSPGVTVSGATTTGNVVTYANTSGALSPTGLVATSASVTANSLVQRDSNGGFKAYDKGGECHNVLGYGADPTGVSDATTQIQAAIDAAQNATHGGCVVIPAGRYLISASLTVGNGSTNTRSNKQPIIIRGAGSGTDRNFPGATEIRWNGSDSSANFMLDIRGPMAPGPKIYNIHLNALAKASGMRVNNVSHGYFEDISVTAYYLGYHLTANSDSDHLSFGNCDNTFTEVRANDPRGGGNGLLIDGFNATNGLDTCSTLFVRGTFVYDSTSGTGGQYALKLKFADNNSFIRTNFYGFGAGSPSGASIVFEQALNTVFPQENHFFACTANQGMTGTAGVGNNNSFIPWTLGDCGFNCDPRTSMSGGTAIALINDQGDLVNMGGGDSSTDENLSDFYVHKRSGAQNGAGVIDFKRSGDTRGRIKMQYFDGFSFQMKNGGGSLTEAFRMLPDGRSGPSALATSTSNTLCYNTGVISGISMLATCSSLSKYKADQSPLESGLDIARKLVPISYRSLTNNRIEAGFIAEQVEAIDPRFSTYDGNGSLVGVEYGHLTAIAIKAIQELEARIKKLEERAH